VKAAPPLYLLAALLFDLQQVDLQTLLHLPRLLLGRRLLRAQPGDLRHHGRYRTASEQGTEPRVYVIYIFDMFYYHRCLLLFMIWVFLVNVSPPAGRQLSLQHITKRNTLISTSLWFVGAR